MKLEDLMKDEALTAKILEAEDFDEVLSRLRENGVEFDEAALRAILATDGEELDESALENVAGGGKLRDAIDWLADKLRKYGPKPSPLRPKIPHLKR